MNRGQFMFLVVVWFCIWLGHTSDNWVVSGLGFTLVYAALNFMGDLIPKKPKKEVENE